MRAKRLLHAVMALAGLVAGLSAVAAGEPPPLPPLPADIKLSNGFVMKQCKILDWKEDAIIVKYVGGTAPIRYVNIDAKLRPLFEAHKKDELSNQAKEAVAAAGSPAGDPQTAAERAEAARVDSAREAAEREEAERRAYEIKKGVVLHYLVKGMNMTEAQEAFGGRPKVTTAGNTTTWIITARGKGVDVSGYIKDFRMQFVDGLLTDWGDN